MKNLNKQLRVYKIEATTSQEKYTFDATFTTFEEASKTAKTLTLIDFNAEEKENLCVEVWECQQNKTLREIADELGYIDDEGNLDEDITFEELIEDAMDEEFEFIDYTVIKTIPGLNSIREAEEIENREQVSAAVQEAVKEISEEIEKRGYFFSMKNTFEKASKYIEIFPFSDDRETSVTIRFSDHSANFNRLDKSSKSTIISVVMGEENETKNIQYFKPCFYNKDRAVEVEGYSFTYTMNLLEQMIYNVENEEK